MKRIMISLAWAIFMVTVAEAGDVEFVEDFALAKDRAVSLRQLIPGALRTATFAGVQFRGTIPASATQRWFTFNWPAQWHVVWTVVPTSPHAGAPQIRWRVQVERASFGFITYWINITNLTAFPVDIEARYDVLGW